MSAAIVALKPCAFLESGCCSVYIFDASRAEKEEYTYCILEGRTLDPEESSSLPHKKKGGFANLCARYG